MNIIKQKISSLSLLPHLILTAVSFAAYRISNIILDASYARSKFPVPFFEGQTAFDGDLIKSYYQFMIDAGTLNIYWQTQLIDFIFIASFFLFGMIMPLLVRRLYKVRTIPYRIATLVATLIPLGTIFDVLENLVSFVMLAQPLTFPNWIAIIYSSLATLKFASIGLGFMLLLASVVWFVVATIINHFRTK